MEEEKEERHSTACLYEHPNTCKIELVPKKLILKVQAALEFSVHKRFAINWCLSAEGSGKSNPFR
jgi:hypothetical protein